MHVFIIRSKTLVCVCFLMLIFCVMVQAATIVNKLDQKIIINLNNGKKIEILARGTAVISSSDLSSPHLKALVQNGSIEIKQDADSSTAAKNVPTKKLEKKETTLKKIDASKKNNGNTGSQPRYSEKTLTCTVCGQEFIFTVGEQEFYASKGFTNVPTRCKECRDGKKTYTGSSDGNGSEKEMYDAVCSKCGKEIRVPVKPKQDRPVYCNDCFKTNR